MELPLPLGEEEGLYTLRKSIYTMKICEKRSSKEHITKEL